MENLEPDKLWPLESAQSTDKGKKRANNEDWVTGFEPNDPDEIRNSGSLYIVADGVGGASKGERASQFAADKVLFDFFQEPNLHPSIRLQKAMRNACNEIYEYTLDNNLSRMATTMVAANIRGNSLTAANVGDSRCYLIRSGKVVQITQDHNVASELVRNGSLTPDAAKHAKGSNTLLRSLGGEPDVDVDIFGEIDLYPGDIVILCSDGLTRYIENDDLLRFCSDGTAEQMSQRLVDFANESGGADNVSVYVIKVGSDLVNREADEAKTLPVPISLDSYKPKGAKKRLLLSMPGIKPLTRGKIVNIGLASVFIILLAFAAVNLFSDKKSPPAIPVEIASPTPSNSLATSLPTENTTSTSDSAPIDPTGVTPISTLQSPVHVDPTAPPTEIATIPPTQTTQEIPSIDSNVYACVYVVPDDGNISTIFGYYGIDNYLVYVTEREEDKVKVLGRSRDRVLGRYNSCDLTEGFCSDQRDIEETTDYRVIAGQFVIIPEDNEEKCKNPEFSDGIGYWISVNP